MKKLTCFLFNLIYILQAWLARLKLTSGDSKRLYVLCMWWWMGNIMFSVFADLVKINKKRNELAKIKSYDFRVQFELKIIIYIAKIVICIMFIIFF